MVDLEAVVRRVVVREAAASERGEEDDAGDGADEKEGQQKTEAEVVEAEVDEGLPARARGQRRGPQQPRGRPLLRRRVHGAARERREIEQVARHDARRVPEAREERVLGRVVLVVREALPEELPEEARPEDLADDGVEEADEARLQVVGRHGDLGVGHGVRRERRLRRAVAAAGLRRLIAKQVVGGRGGASGLRRLIASVLHFSKFW